MRVLVTGGAGRVGNATTRRLLDNGWEVRVIGLEDGIDIPGAEFVKCDVLNYEALRQQMRGCQAVIHLAAISSPVLAKGYQVFDSNASGTFHVFEAASAEGIRRIAHASSINAIGAVYSLTDFKAHYFPIDEDHPTYTTDPYSFGKNVVEQIGEYYWRRDGISSVALRLPGVRVGGWQHKDDYQRQRDHSRSVIAQFAALSDDERAARIAEIQRTMLEVRRSKVLEYRDGPPDWRQARQGYDDLWAMYTFDRFNLWTVIDDRDAAQALEKGLTADYEGAHALFVNDQHNTLGYDSRALVHLFFPDVSDSNVNLSGTQSLVSIEKARQLIGFEPAYSVGDLLS
ncbi:MAG: NAD(P)-dependent oxidoreductase [Anaerolineae bacterium]|nr:NAD(P)-dependent oxidoreductase [Anaerolineae bacterium]